VSANEPHADSFRCPRFSVARSYEPVWATSRQSVAVLGAPLLAQAKTLEVNWRE
jgi:hypothetical protein